MRPVGFNLLHSAGIPIPSTLVYAHLPATTGMDDLKTIAVSRLMLDNFPHIKAYWVTLTPPVAQIALRFGADDLDGTIIEERIIHGAGTPTSLGMTRAQIEKLIRPMRPHSGRTRHALQSAGNNERKTSSTLGATLSDQVCSRGLLARVPPSLRNTVLEARTRAKAARQHTWPAI